MYEDEVVPALPPKYGAMPVRSCLVRRAASDRVTGPRTQALTESHRTKFEGEVSFKVERMALPRYNA
jgi:hypothetical protein